MDNEICAKINYCFNLLGFVSFYSRYKHINYSKFKVLVNFLQYEYIFPVKTYMLIECCCRITIKIVRQLLIATNNIKVVVTSNYRVTNYLRVYVYLKYLFILHFKFAVWVRAETK